MTRAVVHLRAATPADRAMLEEWDTYPHVVDAGGPDDEVDWGVELARDDDWLSLLVVEAGGVAVGLVQVIDPAREESHYWGDVGPGLRAVDIWIGPPEHLGRGHGSAAMQQVLDRCFADPGVAAVLVDPLARNVDAIRFYHRLGFETVEARRFGNDDCLVLRLDRRRWDEVRPR